MGDADTDKPQDSGLTAKLLALAIENQQLLKYFVIGVTASVIDLVLFFILLNLIGASELLAHSVSVSIAAVFSFMINARHNFKTRDYALIRFISFCIVCLIGYAAGYAVIKAVQALFTDPVIGANIGKIASLPFVFIIQYILNSRITFREVNGANKETT